MFYVFVLFCFTIFIQKLNSQLFDCDKTCKTCTNIGNLACTSCFDGDIFYYNSYCITPSYVTIQVNEASTVEIYKTWTPIPSSLPISEYDCSGLKLIATSFSGGFQKTFQITTTHYMVRFKMVVFFIDDWNGLILNYFVDNVKIQSKRYFPVDVYSSAFCGNAADKEAKFMADISVPHTATSFTLKITSEKEPSDTSIFSNLKIGFREYVIYSYICDSSCSSCSGPTTNDCQSCPKNKFLQSGVCVDYCYPSFFKLNSTCLEHCPDGYFQDLDNQLCILSCPDGKYADVNKRCQNCSYACAICTGGAQNNCSKCAPNFYFQKSQNLCESKCQQPYYSNTINKTCDPICPKDDNGTVIYSSERYLSCSKSCNGDEIMNSTTLKCDACPDNCATCNSRLPNDCKTCFPGFSFSNGECLANCLAGFYLNSNKTQCLSCNSPCIECFGDSKNCTSCKDTYFLDGNTCQNSSMFCPNNLYGDSFLKKCAPNCSLGTYPNIDGKHCDSCPTNCLKCKNNVSCLECEKGSFLEPQFKTCVKQCPDGKAGEPSQKICLSCGFNFFLNPSNLCQSCHPNCTTCQGPNDYQCLQCSENNYYSQGGQCFENCFNGYYSNTTTGVCTNCNSQCKNCIGETESNCTSCIVPKLLQSGTCRDNCSVGYYLNQTIKECPKCSISCNSCFDGKINGCSSCPSSRVAIVEDTSFFNNLGFLDPSFPISLICQCKPMYLEISKPECLGCYVSCEICSSQEDNRCEQCNAPRGTKSTYSPIEGYCRCPFEYIDEFDHGCTYIVDSPGMMTLKVLMVFQNSLAPIFMISLYFTPDYFIFVRLLETVQDIGTMRYFNMSYPLGFDYFLNFLSPYSIHTIYPNVVQLILNKFYQKENILYVKETFDGRTAPYIVNQVPTFAFLTNGISNSFLYNAGNLIIILISAVLIALLVKNGMKNFAYDRIKSIKTKNYEISLARILKHIQLRMEYSFFFEIWFLLQFDGLLFILLQFYKIDFSVSFNIVSIIFMLIFIGYFLFMLIWMIKKLKMNPEKEDEKFQKKYMYLFTNYQQSSVFTKYYLLAYLLKKFCIMAALVYGMESGKTQSTLVLGVRMIFLVYLRITNPFKDKLANNIFQIIEALQVISQILIYIISDVTFTSSTWAPTGILLITFLVIEFFTINLFTGIRSLMNIQTILKKFRVAKRK